MLKTETLSQLKQLKQEIKASRNLHQGQVKGTSNKFGFVTLDNGKDVFLPADEMARVLPGDRIEVEVKKEPGNKTLAIVERLLESPTKEFFGKYVTRGKAHFVEADIPGMSQWLFVPPQKRKQAKAKDLVRCKLTQHPIKNGKAQAAVLEVIGAEADPGVEWTYTMRKYGIKDGWPAEVEKQIADLDQSTIDQLAEGREDLSALPFVTIDSASTQDMDDALWIERQGEKCLLRIAIADPASVVAKDSALEKELKRRAISVYFPGLAVPMLPPRLSRDLCSLQEGVLRLAKVLELEIDQNGEARQVRLVNANIRSHRKLSYVEAAALIEQDGEDELALMLKELKSCTDALADWRQKQALTQEGKAEFSLELNERKKIERILPRELTAAHAIVEECMLAANRCIAELLAEQDVDSVFACHDGIRDERRETLEKVVKAALPELGDLDLGCLESYVECLRQLRSMPEHQQLVSLINRQLNRTTLLPRPAPHFALGFKAYTTFTSPLRKASDFLLHQQVDALLSGEQPAAIPEQQVSQLDQSVQDARAAVYELEQWLKCQFMNTRSSAYTAKVIRVFASGCQIRLEENGVEGFISVRDLGGKFSYNQELMQLKGAEYQFELDQSLSVKKKLVDWSRKQIMFVPCDSEAE